VTREEKLSAVWYEAHMGLREYLEAWVDVDTARTAASKACAIFVEQAADGMQLKVGPYGQLYAAAYACIGPLSMRFEIPSDEIAQAAVPAHARRLPYDLSKVYTDVWKASQLLHWDRKTIHRVTRGLALTWPVSDSGWAELGVTPLGNLVPPLVRRAVETLDHHRCLDCKICTEAAVRWEYGDNCTEAWLTARRVAKEEAACQTEERSPSQ